MRAVLAEGLFLLRDGLVRLLEAQDFEIAAAAEAHPGPRRAPHGADRVKLMYAGATGRSGEPADQKRQPRCARRR